MTYYIGNIPVSDELYHHGILGMKWGQRNGPPYPLDQEDKSAAEKRAEKGASESSEKETTARRKKTSLRVLKRKDKRIDRGRDHTIPGSLAKVVFTDILGSAAAKSFAEIGMATMDPILATTGAYTLFAPIMAVNTIRGGREIVDRIVYLKSLRKDKRLTD